VIHLKGERKGSGLNDKLNEIKALIRELRLRLKSDFKLPAAIAVLLDYPCHKRCIWELSSKRVNLAVDPFYLQRHEFVKNRFIELLCIELSNRGLNPKIISEDSEELGTVDVVIKNIGSGFAILNNSINIRVEIKTGASLDLNQIIRYLVNCDSLVLLRVPSEDAIILRRREFLPVIERTLTLLQEKLKCMLEHLDNPSVIPGRYCATCGAECDYASKVSRNYKNNYANLERDLKSALIKTDKAIYKAIQLIITEIENDLSGDEKIE